MSFMNTETSRRRTLIRPASENQIELVNGIQTTDLTGLPDMKCIVCTWKGDTYELDKVESDEDSLAYSCPDCGNTKSLADISYQLSDKGDLYEIEQTLERAFEIPAKLNSRYEGNLFVELRTQSIPVIEGAVVTSFDEPEQGTFRIKPSGEMQFEPPKDFIGIVPVNIKIELQAREQRFIARFFVRKDIQILGED